MAYIIVSDEFIAQCEITRHRSILWHELYLDPTGGDFQLELPADKYLPYIQKGYYIVNDDSDKFGIIDTYKVEDTDEGRILTVSGSMGESILSRRIIHPTISLNGPLYQVVNRLMELHITAPSNTNRKISNFTFSPNELYSAAVSKQFTGKTLADAIAGLCGALGYSYAVTIDIGNQCFSMELISGTDRSFDQSDIASVVFSSRCRDVSDFVYLTSDAGTYTHVVCAGEGEGAERKIVIQPTYSTPGTTGINRREIYLDSGSISSDMGDGKTLTDAAYAAKLRAEANEKLAQSSATEACEGVVSLGRYRYKKDFCLGDLVSIQDEDLGIGYTARVLGVLVSVDENGTEDITIETGNLQVVDVSDDTEEDSEGETTEYEDDTIVDEAEDADGVEDTGTEDGESSAASSGIIDIVFEWGAELAECDAAGTDGEAKGRLTGIVQVLDDAHLRIEISGCVRYLYIVKVASSSGGYTIPSAHSGTMYLDLTDDQFGQFGATLISELSDLLIPVHITTDRDTIGFSLNGRVIAITDIASSPIDGGVRITATHTMSLASISTSAPMELVTTNSWIVPIPTTEDTEEAEDTGETESTEESEET